MYILGISSYSHESSAALIKDGEIKFLIEEERLNREKHTSRFPYHAIRAGLEKEGITFKDIDQVTFFWKPWREIFNNAGHMLRFFPASLNLLTGTSGGGEYSFLARVWAKLNVSRDIQRHFRLARPPKVRFVEHHLAHAASAFFVSPFDEAAILTVDGRGESTTTMLAVGQGNRIDKIKEICAPHSLGHLYAAVTNYLGFRAFHDEWKVMGMSAYGQPTFVKEFEDMVRLTDDGGYRLNLKYFKFHTHGQKHWVSGEFEKKLGPRRKPTDGYDQRHFDIAYGLQYVVERTGIYLARHLREITQQKNLCMTGGVVLNCLMNKRIVEESGFGNYFFQPVANDAGTSLGSALYEYHETRRQPRRTVFDSIYLGLEFNNYEIERALKERKVNYRRSENIARDAARCIADGKIVGWFQGRMEAGPRALGSRSITVDPRDPKMKDRLNERVKRREFFRPFAPSVLEEKAAEYFIFPKGQPSPYMILIADVRPEKKDIIPAVTHADGTARFHTVSKRTNPLYWQLIAEFEKITGVPVIINTSFNENEPIVCTPEDAVNCFLRTDFDVLAIGDYIVEKGHKVKGSQSHT